MCPLVIKHLADEEELPSLHSVVAARITSKSQTRGGNT